MVPEDRTGADLLLMRELQEVVGGEFNRHLRTAKEWMPHEYVEWSAGRNFPALFEDGQAWAPEQSKLTSLGRAALILNLLTEDNLPSYHYEIASMFGRDHAWGAWVHRWTAEEARHSIVIRDYLLTSRAIDPERLERLRMTHVSTGYVSENRHSFLHLTAYLTLQELATRIAHRYVGEYCGDPICERILVRVAMDENLHMVFYRNVLAAALDLDPDATVQALRDVATTFRMPGHEMPGFSRAAAQMAIGGVYNLRIHHDEVVQPVLRYLKVLDIGGLTARGLQAQQELGEYMDELNMRARDFDDKLVARKARLAR